MHTEVLAVRASCVSERAGGAEIERHIIYLFSFRESVQDYKIHMDMEIVKFS